jgi:hypothetical protein
VSKAIEVITSVERRRHWSAAEKEMTYRIAAGGKTGTPPRHSRTMPATSPKAQ